MRMKWAQLLSGNNNSVLLNKTIAGRRKTLLLNVKPARMSVKNLSSSFFSFSFLFFFLLFIDFHCQKKGTCYYFIDDVRVRVCAEDGLKDSFSFLRLNF